MSSILETYRKKRRAEMGLVDLGDDEYKDVKKEDEERQKLIEKLESDLQTMRSPSVKQEKKEEPVEILDDSNPAGDTDLTPRASTGPTPLERIGRIAATAETAAENVASNVFNQAANIVAVGNDFDKAIASLDADALIEYSKGNHGILNSLAFKRLESSDVAKNIPAVAVMTDEIKRGVYKGTAEDIKETLDYGYNTNYIHLYNQKVAPVVNQAKDTQETNRALYGQAGDLINTVAGGAAGIGQFALNTSLGGPIFAGAMAGLSRDSSQNPEQVLDTGLDQVAQDIGVDVGLGALFSYLMGEATGAVNSAVENAIPKTVLSKAGIIARNVFSGASGGYMAAGTTGTLRNIYNKLQGREVTSEQAVEPWWSTDTAIAVFMGALFNGISGTQSDLAKAEQIRALLNKESELNAQLSAYSRDIAKNFESINQKGVQESYNNGKQAIYDFFKKNDLGKATDTIRNEYLKKWFDYHYNMGIAFEDLTSSGSASRPQGAVIPQLTSGGSTTPQPSTPNVVVPPPSVTNPANALGNARAKIKDYMQAHSTTQNELNNIKKLTDENINVREDSSNIQMIKPQKIKDDNIMIGNRNENDIDFYIEQIKNHGFMTPVFVSNETDNVVGGAYALLVAQELGLDQVPVKYVDSSTDIDFNSEDWNNQYKEVQKNGQATLENVDGKRGAESSNDTRGAGLNGNGGNISKGGKISNQVFRNDLRPNDEGIHDSNTVLRQNVTNKGTKISDDLAERVKNSKVRDSRGYIVEAYHGTPAKFTEFKDEYIGKANGKGWGDGFYFTSSLEDAEGYAGDDGNVMKEVLNIEHPFYSGSRYEDLSPRAEEIIEKYDGGKKSQPYIDYVKGKLETAVGAMDYFKSLASKNSIDTRPILKYLGYDGIIDGDRYVVFNKEQIKDIKNEHPTNDPDTLKEDTEKYTSLNKDSEKGSFSMPKNNPLDFKDDGKPHVVKKKYRKKLKDVGYINVNGTKIESVDDLAEMCQIFRSSKNETFRIFFTKGNIASGQKAYTTHSLDGVSFPDDLFQDCYDYAKKIGADGIWIMHNHPSGDVTPSAPDKGTTEKAGKLWDKLFKGHIIIDHNKYSYLNYDKAADYVSTEVDIPLKKGLNDNLEKNMNIEPWNQMAVKGMEEVAQLASSVVHSKDYSTLIFTDTKKRATALVEVPNKFFEQEPKKINAYLDKFAKDNGANAVFLGTTSKPLFTDLSKFLHLYDTVLYTDTLGGIEVLESRAKEGDFLAKIPEERNITELRASKKAAKEPVKKLGFDAVDKGKQALEKANNELKDKLVKQEKDYEKKLAKKDEEIKSIKEKNKQKDVKRKVRLEAKKKEASAEKRFKQATPKGKLKILGKKIEKQTGYYEINNYPELDEVYEKEFGKTIRQTIQTLHSNKILPYLPSDIQEIVNRFNDETYLKANWKTFDKYLKEALKSEELKKLAESMDTPMSNRLLRLIKEHNQAPITIKTAKEMYDDLQILSDIVELAKERLDYRRQPDNFEETITKAAEELEEIGKDRTPAKLGKVKTELKIKGEALKSLMMLPQWLETAIQQLFGGDPDSPLKVIWDEFLEGDEKEALLDSEYARLFDSFTEKTAGGWRYVKDLEEDFSKNAKPIDTGITGTNPATGKPYSENAKLTKDIIMHIVASSRNTDNLMSFSKVLLGDDYKGNPVYSNPGGYIVPNEDLMDQGKISEAYNRGKKYVFSMEEIRHLESLLTKTEKDFVDACLKVGDLTAKYGNEVSQKLIGRDLFTVKNYIRIIRDKNTFDQELIDPAKLDNLSNATSEQYVGIGGLLGRGGSLEARNHRSSRPIYGEGLLHSVSHSFGGAKRYIAYALPLYDSDYLLKSRLPDTFEKVDTVDKKPSDTLGMQYVEVDELPRNGAEHTMYYIDNGDGYDVYKRTEQGKTMEQLIVDAGGEEFLEYYQQFVNRIVGRNTDYSSFASIRAKVVLNANLKVAATQFFSYFQIGQFLNYPTQSMTKALVDGDAIFRMAKDYLEEAGEDLTGLSKQEVVNKVWELVNYKNTQRGLGKFSSDVHYIEAGSTILGRVNSGKLLSTVDKFTVDMTYRALAEDIMADGIKFGSEKFFDEFKRRMYTIYQSNPQYGRIWKTPLQNRSSSKIGNSLSTALSQFQTVMIEGYNNALQAKMGYEYYKQKGDKANTEKYKKRFWRSIKGLLISSLLLVGMRDFIDGLAGKKQDEEYQKRIGLSFMQNVLSYTIIGDEIFGAILNYNNFDLTTNELSYFNTLLNTLGDMSRMVTNFTPPAIIKTIKSLGQVLGVPANGMDDILGVARTLTNSNTLNAYSVMKDKNKYSKWLKNQEAIGDDFKTFYEISQVMTDKILASKYGWVKGSKADTYGAKSSAKGRAIMDILGIEQGKRMTKEQRAEYAKWYNVFKD